VYFIRAEWVNKEEHGRVFVQGDVDRGRCLMYLMLPPLLLHSTHSPLNCCRRGSLDNTWHRGRGSISLSYIAHSGTTSTNVWVLHN